MGKMEFLDALKRAMIGLPPETQAKTLAYYEQRFVDGVASGRNEEEIGRELDDPKKIALTLRANTHLNAFTEKKSPVNLVRLVISAVGLAIFNLFMVVPAAVFGALLTALYACAFAFYVSGIVVTAAGLAGANEYVFQGPVKHVVFENGHRVEERGGSGTVTIGPLGVQFHKDDDKDLTEGESGTVRIVNDMEGDSRTAQTAVGVGLVIGGIALLLAALVITRYTFIGIKRYLQMNLSLLKGG